MMGCVLDLVRGVTRRYETYLIPGKTLIPGGKLEREAFHPGIGFASNLTKNESPIS